AKTVLAPADIAPDDGETCLFVSESPAVDATGCARQETRRGQKARITILFAASEITKALPATLAGAEVALGSGASAKCTVCFNRLDRSAAARACYRCCRNPRRSSESHPETGRPFEGCSCQQEM